MMPQRFFLALLFYYLLLFFLLLKRVGLDVFQTVVLTMPMLYALVCPPHRLDYAHACHARYKNTCACSSRLSRAHVHV